MDRRTVLIVTGTSLTAHAFHWTLGESESLARAAAGDTLSRASLHRLRTVTDELRLMDAEMGGESLVGLGEAHLSLAIDLLDHASYDDATGRALAAVAADNAALTGWLHFDAGRHAAAQRYLVVALRAANAAADPRHGAQALSSLAVQSYSVGDPRDAVRLMQTAQNHNRHLDAPHLHAMLKTRQARGHAKLGEAQRTHRAIGEAEELFARGRGPDDPDFLYWMTPGEISGQAASCYLDLGAHAHAREAFERAAATMADRDVRTTALFHSRAALAHLGTGDAEQAATTAHRSLDHAEHLHSRRLTEHLATMATAFAPFAARGVGSDVTDRTAGLLARRAYEHGSAHA